MAERIELRQPGAERGIQVTEESADYWRSLGYQDAQVEEKSEAKAPTKKAAPRKRATKNN
jgi:hypothetical protein